ncbi:hypothetical protein Ccrd_001364, partial [Cynara cardunculus var. scolymus]
MLTTCLGGNGVSCIQNKTCLGLYPGVGTREALFNMNSGRLDASFDGIKPILVPISPQMI